MTEIPTLKNSCKVKVDKYIALSLFFFHSVFIYNRDHIALPTLSETFSIQYVLSCPHHRMVISIFMYNNVFSDPQINLLEIRKYFLLKFYYCLNSFWFFSTCHLIGCNKLFYLISLITRGSFSTNVRCGWGSQLRYFGLSLVGGAGGLGESPQFPQNWLVYPLFPILYPKCWFCNFRALFRHFAQNTLTHQSTPNGKPWYSSRALVTSNLQKDYVGSELEN